MYENSQIFLPKQPNTKLLTHLIFYPDSVGDVGEVREGEGDDDGDDEEAV